MGKQETFTKKTCIPETDKESQFNFINTECHQEPISLCIRRTNLAQDPELADVGTARKSPGS